MPIVGAAYLRCSDPKQDKSIDQQRVEIERRAAADGVVIPPENWFIDEGISGRSTKRRTSYQGLIKRAEAQRDARPDLVVPVGALRTLDRTLPSAVPPEPSPQELRDAVASRRAEGPGWGTLLAIVGAACAAAAAWTTR